MKRNTEGQAATLTRKQRACNDISASVYTGRGSRFTFDMYAAKHVNAHNELLALGERVPETKKVTDFLNGIQAQSLEVSKRVVDGDTAKL